MAKSKGGGTVQTVTALIEPTLTQMGLKLWDVRFEKEGPDYFLRIFIDRDTPLDMETCEAATRAVNPIIDEADPISQGYYMELGSPGLGRKLTKDEHFAAKIGEMVEVVFIRPNEKGEKTVRGILVSKNADALIVKQDENEVSFPNQSISYVKLCDDDDLF